MNCATCSEIIYDYLDNELDDSTRSELERHLTRCEVCRLELAEIKEGINIYRNWGNDVAPSAEFTTEVMTRLNHFQPVSAYPLLRVVGVGLVTVLAILAFFVVPVLYSLATVVFDLFINVLPLPGIYLAAFPTAQTVSLAALAVMLAGMTWTIGRVIEY